MNIRSGDDVTWWANWRGSSINKNPGGWIRHEHTGIVIKVNRVTLVVLRDNWNMPETIRRERVIEVKHLPF